MLLAILFVIATAVSSSFAGQTSASDVFDISEKVDSYVVAVMHAERIPGLALGIARDGQVVKARGYALANVELDVPVKPETIFQTGSVGKQFTATAVMMLAEVGKIHTDDPISK